LFHPSLINQFAASCYAAGIGNPTLRQFRHLMTLQLDRSLTRQMARFAWQLTRISLIKRNTKSLWRESIASPIANAKNAGFI
jgi:hypothetical protein